MFNLFKKKDKKKAETERVEPQMGNHPAEQALLRTIEEKKKEDPLIGLKIGAAEVKSQLLNAMKSERGVHIESALATLASLAGYYCLIAAVVRHQNGGVGFHTVGGNDGKTYFMGDLINGPLLEEKYSVWSLVGGMAQSLGAEKLPDIHDIAGHVASTIGGENFGKPRLPENHQISELPSTYVASLVDPLKPTVNKFATSADEMPILMALAISQLMSDAKDVIEPGLACLIVMECAIPMSKIDAGGKLEKQ